MGGCSLVHWFGESVSRLPRTSLRAQVAGCMILLELMGLMNRALMKLVTDKEAEQLAQHLQGHREFAPPLLVQKVVRYTFDVVKQVLKHCKSVCLVLEGDHPTKSCRHERAARRDDNYRSCKWRGAICPSDCMVRALMTEISHWQDASSADLAPDRDTGRLRVHAAVYEADGYICHSLLRATPGTVWALIWSNDCDFAVHDRRIAEHCVYNCQVSGEDLVGSVLSHDNFLQRNHVSLRVWPVVKRLACVTLAGNDYFKREGIGPESAFDIVERVWEEPSKTSPLDNLVRIQTALHDPTFNEKHPLKPGYNGFLAACLSSVCMLVDTGQSSPDGSTIFDTMYPYSVFDPATPEQVASQIPYQLTLDHRGWRGTGFAEIAEAYVHVGDDSCTVAKTHSAPMTSPQNPRPEPEVCDARPAVHTTSAAQLFQLHQKQMEHSPMLWTVDHQGSTLNLRLGQRISFAALDVSTVANTVVSSLKVHCQRQGHSVRVARSASSGQGLSKVMGITLACSHQATSAGKPSHSTESTDSADTASTTQATDATAAVSQRRTVFPLDSRTQADMDDISQLPRRGQRQHAALAGCLLADQAVPTAQHFHNAWLRATKGGRQPNMERKSEANYIDAIGTGMILAASRAPGAADTGISEKIGGRDGCFSEHLHAVLPTFDEEERETLQICTALRADGSSSVISSADAYTADTVICLRRVNESSIGAIRQKSDQGCKILESWKEELAVNAVLFKRSRGIFIAFTIDKMTGQLGRREVIECSNLDLKRGQWAIDCIRSARARLHALPVQLFPPRHQYLKLPVPVQPPTQAKRRKMSRVSSQMGHVCEPLCRIRLNFFVSMKARVELRVPGFQRRTFSVDWTFGHQQRQCNLPAHPPPAGGQQFCDDEGEVLSLSKRQRAEVRSWLLQLEASEESADSNLSPLSSGDGTFVALRLDRCTTAEVTTLVEHHSHPRVRVEPPDARLLPEAYSWQAAMHQARLGRPFASILAELEEKGLGGVTRKDLANLKTKTLTQEQASWVRNWTSDELKLHDSGGCSELFVQLLRDDSKLFVLSARRSCVSGTSTASSGGRPSRLRLLKVPTRVAAQWGDTEEEGKPYRLYSFTSSGVNEVLQRSPPGELDTRWSVADRLFRPTTLRPRFLQPWDLEDAGGGALQITSMIHTNETQMRRFIRSPHRLHVDGTFGCSTTEYVSIFPVGQTPDPFNLCLGSAIARSENQEDIGFLLLEAIPLLYGRSLAKVRVVMADGSPVLQKVIQAAVERRVLGDALTIVRQCYFHAVVLPMVSKLLRFASAQGADHPIRLALATTSATRRLAATEEEVWSGLDKMHEHIEHAQSLPDLPSTAKDKLQDWSHSVRLNAAKLFPGISPGLLTFGLSTSSPVEAEHSAAKGRGYRSGQTGLGKDKSLATGALVEAQRQVLREIEFKRRDAAHLAKVVSGVPASLGVQLTTAANKHLRHSLQDLGSRFAFSRNPSSENVIVCKELTSDGERQIAGLQAAPIVHLHIEDAKIRCSRRLCPSWQSGFPCPHQIHLNLGRVEAYDFHPIHLSSVATGALDDQIHFSAETVQPVLLPLRVRLDDIPVQAVEEEVGTSIQDVDGQGAGASAVSSSLDEIRAPSASQESSADTPASGPFSVCKSGHAIVGWLVMRMTTGGHSPQPSLHPLWP